jgi:lipopolysaccharide export system protein LptA
MQGRSYSKPKRKKTNSKYLFLNLIIIIINSYFGSVYAKSNDNKQNIQVEADTLLFNNETKIGIYQGHIKLIQGTRLLTADYATSYSNQTGQIIKIVATGHPARYCADVFHNRPQLIAIGNTIYYYPLKDWLEAVGDAQIIQGENHFKGPKINYDFKKKTVGSSPSKQGHTHIILAPLQTMHS